MILVANDVPAPHEIDDAWLLEHDWVLRRTILDDSFRPALDYLCDSFVGAEVNIRLLEANVLVHRNVVLAVKQEIEVQAAILRRDEQDVLEAVRDLGQSQQQQGIVDIVKRIFDPIGITGTADTGVVTAAEGMLDYAKETRDRADRERARLLSQLEIAMNALQGAVDKLSAAVREHYDKVARRSTGCGCTSRKTSSITCRRSGVTSRRISASSASTTSTSLSSRRRARR